MREVEAYISALVFLGDNTLETTKIIVSEQFVGDEAISEEEVERLWNEAKQKVDWIRGII